MGLFNSLYQTCVVTEAPVNEAEKLSAGHAIRPPQILIEGYAFLVPFVEDEKTIFLDTIIPSRKMAKLYLELDLVRIQKAAVLEGLPYQALISSVLQKYINGRMIEKAG